MTESSPFEDSIFKKYRCDACGYLLFRQGDPKRGIEPGTAFENLPDDWGCPICRATETFFGPIDND